MRAIHSKHLASVESVRQSGQGDGCGSADISFPLTLNPLPQGEGESSASSSANLTRRRSSRGGSGRLPLPEGEGRGEGEQGFLFADSLSLTNCVCRCAFLLAALCARCGRTLTAVALAASQPSQSRRQRRSLSRPSYPNAARSPAASRCPPSAFWRTRCQHYSPSVYGYLKTLTVDKGDADKEGQLLAEVRSTRAAGRRSAIQSPDGGPSAPTTSAWPRRARRPICSCRNRGRPPRPMGGALAKLQRTQTLLIVCPDHRPSPA